MDPRRVTESEFQSWVETGQHRRAAEWLVLRYADEVMGLCTAMVRDRVAAEDLVQDVFGRAFMGLAGFRAEASSRTWLLKIARNRCIDHLRARQREPWGGVDPDAELEPDALPDDEPMPHDLLDRRGEVEAALDSLAEGDRALIVLRFRNGLDYSELAMAFGLKEGTVRMRVSRALARMRHALEARAEAEEQRAAQLQLGALAQEDMLERTGAPMPRLSRRRAPLPAASAAPAPGSAPPASQGAFAAPAAQRAQVTQVAAKRRGILSRALDAVFGGAPQPPSPPLEHPLTAFFTATRQALSGELRQRLLERAGAV